MNKPTILHKNIEVDILNSDYQKIGEARSIAKASRMLFIKSSAIWTYFFRVCPRNQKNGILSRKLKQRYHFKLK